MTESLKVELNPLVAELFKPYGQVVHFDQGPVFPEVETGEGRVALEMQHLNSRKPETMYMEEMAIHFSYNQTFIPMKGVLILVVAPAPSNGLTDAASIEFNHSMLRGFFIEPGQAAHINKGVWHNAFMIGRECIFINVTRKNEGEGTTQDAKGSMQVTNSRRRYIGFIDLKKRFDQVIQLELGKFKPWLEPATG